LGGRKGRETGAGVGSPSAGLRTSSTPSCRLLWFLVASLPASVGGWMTSLFLNNTSVAHAFVARFFILWCRQPMSDVFRVAINWAHCCSSRAPDTPPDKLSPIVCPLLTTGYLARWVVSRPPPAAFTAVGNTWRSMVFSYLQV